MVTLIPLSTDVSYLVMAELHLYKDAYWYVYNQPQVRLLSVENQCWMGAVLPISWVLSPLSLFPARDLGDMMGVLPVTLRVRSRQNIIFHNQ